GGRGRGGGGGGGGGGEGGVAGQDRGRSRQSAAHPDGTRHRISPGGVDMSSLDVGLARLRTAAHHAYDGWDRFGRWFKGLMPTGLYARSLLIIIVPMVLAQSIVAFLFMERHWNTVTRRLSAAVTQDIAALIEIYKVYPQDPDRTQIRRIAAERLGMQVDFLPASDMPPVGPRPFFSLLDQALSQEIRKQIGRPFWIDTVGRS